MKSTEFREESRNSKLEKFFRNIEENFDIVWEILLWENEKIVIFRQDDKNKQFYVFFYFYNGKLIGYKLWILKSLPNNRLKLYATMNELEIGNSLGNYTMFLLAKYRKKWFGKKLYKESIKYLKNTFRDTELEIVTMSSVPEFHKKIIEDLIHTIWWYLKEKDIDEENKKWFFIFII